jgi:hypothetical protein
MFGFFLSSVLAVLVPGFLIFLSWIFDMGSGNQPS